MGLTFGFFGPSRFLLPLFAFFLTTVLPRKPAHDLAVVCLPAVSAMFHQRAVREWFKVQCNSSTFARLNAKAHAIESPAPAARYHDRFARDPAHNFLLVFRVSGDEFVARANSTIPARRQSKKQRGERIKKNNRKLGVQYELCWGDYAITIKDDYRDCLISFILCGGH